MIWGFPMSNRLKKGDGVPYAQIANSILRHPELSLKAKGLYGYMYSMKSGWTFTASSMAKQLKESRKAILGIIKELKEFGLLEYEKLNSGKGIYTIFSEIKPINSPKSQNDTLPIIALSPETTPCQNDTVSKEDCNKNENTTKNPIFYQNPIEGEDYKSKKSKGKSKKQKLDLTQEEQEYKKKLVNHTHVGCVYTNVLVEGKYEAVYIDTQRKLYTDSRSTKQILSSTLTEIWKQLYTANEARKNANPKKMAQALSKLKG